jgi:hypothetical protein
VAGENELNTETTMSEGETDLSDALDEISAGLGFSPDESDGDGGGIETPAVEPLTQEPALEVQTPSEPAVPAPKTWRAEALAKWSTLPPEVQAEVAKREEDMFKGLETYKADAGFGKTMKSVIDPFMPLMRQHNIDPAQLTSSLMQAHVTLAMGSPEQKQALFAKLAKDYNIDLGGEAPYTDPTVSALQMELYDLKSRLQGREAQEAQTLQAKLSAEIDTFASDPANPYFDEVANDITALLKSGMAKDLADAYSKAIWANPITRAKEQTRLTAEAAAQAKKAAEGKAQAARKHTAANVKTSAKTASGTAATGSIEDTLSETLARIKAGDKS